MVYMLACKLQYIFFLMLRTEKLFLFLFFFKIRFKKLSSQDVLEILLLENKNMK